MNLDCINACGLEVYKLACSNPTSLISLLYFGPFFTFGKWGSSYGLGKNTSPIQGPCQERDLAILRGFPVEGEEFMLTSMWNLYVRLEQDAAVL